MKRDFRKWLSKFKPSISTYNFYVDFEKVHRNVEMIKIELNILNSLIGSNNIELDFENIISKYPETLKCIPILLAVRANEIYTIDSDGEFLYSFKKPNYSIDQYKSFMRKTGLFDLMENHIINNLVDYATGVETGLDSNGRKNRGGQSMEAIVDWFIKDHCNKNSYEYLKEANADKIYDKWRIKVPVDKSSRRYDFIVNTGVELIIFETNFYASSGSKLKSTAGEYRNLFDTLDNKFKFIWITDGEGWLKTSKPLRDTFNHNDYIFNLSMLEHGVLDKI